MNKNQKQVKYSIRKFAIGSFSVAIGFFFAQGNLEVKANNEINLRYEYVKESELTDLEKQHIIKTLSNTVAVEEETYFMVYRPLATTKTPLATNDTDFNPYLAVGGIAFIVCIITARKNKKAAIASFVLITTMGQVIPMTNVQALESKALCQYAKTITLQKGDTLPNPVVKIDGYQFIGYILGSELVTKQVEQKTEQKVEQKTEQKVEPKTEQKIEQKTEQKVETKVETKVDKQPLITALAQLAQLTSKQLDLTTKTPMSRNRYEAALQVAKMQEEQGNTLLTQDDIIQELITKTTQSVTEASKALARAEALLNDQVDKEALRLAKAALLASVDTTNKTPNSIQAYETAYGQFADEITKALQQADTVIANADASEETVATILQQLIALKTRKDEAQKLLVEQADKNVLVTKLQALELLLKEEVDVSNKTEASKMKYEEAKSTGKMTKNAAEVIVADKNATQANVESEVQKVTESIKMLQAAKAGLEEQKVTINTTELQTLLTTLTTQLEQESELMLATKTPATQAKYASAKSQAEAVSEAAKQLLKNTDATQVMIDAETQKVNEVLNKLLSAIEQLVEKADKTSLRTAITKLDQRADTTNKTDSSAEAYRNLIANMQADIDAIKTQVNDFLADENATKTQEMTLSTKVSELQAKLDTFAGLLVDKINKSLLKTELNKLKEKLAEEINLADKTSESKTRYEDVKRTGMQVQEEAQKVVDDVNATQEAVDSVLNKVMQSVSALENAKKLLQVEVNKTELKKQIDIAKTKQSSEYTEASFAKLTEALNSAKTVDDDATANQATVDSAMTKLQEAITHLEKKAVPPVEEVIVNTHMLNTNVNNLRLLINNVVKLDDKTPATKQNYETVKAQAQTVLTESENMLASTEITQNGVDEQAKKVKQEIDKMLSARSHLEFKAEKKRLEEMVKKLDERAVTADKTSESTKLYNQLIAEMQPEIDEAKTKVSTLLANENATRDEEILLLNKVEELEQRLTGVAKLLAKKVQKDTLKSSLDMLKDLLQASVDSEGKSEEAKKRYEEAKAKGLEVQAQAQAIYDNPEATKQEVEEVTDKLMTQVSELNEAKSILETEGQD